MALSCSTTAINYEDFEFIDCNTININYDVKGIATISLTVVTTSDTLLNDYTNLTFGGVNYELTMHDVQVSIIPGTLVYQFQLSMTGFGC